jgi:DnaK suppressor protein
MTTKELQDLKKILLERKEQIIKNINSNKEHIEGLKNSSASDEVDYATISADSAIEEALSMKQSKELKEIEYSLFKTESDNYGICEMCEDEIGIERLKVKPQAKYCIVCREIVENNNN